MPFKIEFKGLDELRRDLKEFSDRRFKAAVSTSLTRTAKAMSERWQRHIIERVDRPTPLTQKATVFLSATAETLKSTVKVKDSGASTPQAEYLFEHEVGGDRTMKKFEQALRSSGALPNGYVTVPGRKAQRNAYGNVSRALIVAIISQLGTDFSPGYQRVISKSTKKRLDKQRERGRRFIVILPDASSRLRVSPGIYERMPDDKLVAQFLYKPRATYIKRFELEQLAEREGPALMFAEFNRAVDESFSRMKA